LRLPEVEPRSSSKKERDEAKRRLKLAKQQRERMYGPGSFIDMSIVDKLDIRGEIAYITQRAQAEELHIVNIESLIMFSTRTRDAWLLEKKPRMKHGLNTDTT
jgi:hypothetical protein